MNSLKLEKKDEILNLLFEYSGKDKQKQTILMEEFLSAFQKNKFSEIQKFQISNLQKTLNTTTEETEQMLFSVLSWELTREYSDNFLKNVQPETKLKINSFLDINFKPIFDPYYKDKGYVSEKDYEDCVISLTKTYHISIEEADIFLGDWLENIIFV